MSVEEDQSIGRWLADDFWWSDDGWFWSAHGVLSPSGMASDGCPFGGRDGERQSGECQAGVDELSEGFVEHVGRIPEGESLCVLGMDGLDVSYHDRGRRSMQGVRIP